MEVYVNYPTTEKGWDMFYGAVAEFHVRVVIVLNSLISIALISFFI